MRRLRRTVALQEFGRGHAQTPVVGHAHAHHARCTVIAAARRKANQKADGFAGVGVGGGGCKQQRQGTN